MPLIYLSRHGHMVANEIGRLTGVTSFEIEMQDLLTAELRALEDPYGVDFVRNTEIRATLGDLDLFNTGNGKVSWQELSNFLKVNKVPPGKFLEGCQGGMILMVEFGLSQNQQQLSHIKICLCWVRGKVKF